MHRPIFVGYATSRRPSSECPREWHCSVVVEVIASLRGARQPMRILIAGTADNFALASISSSSSSSSSSFVAHNLGLFFFLVLKGALAVESRLYLLVRPPCTQVYLLSSAWKSWFSLSTTGYPHNYTSTSVLSSCCSSSRMALISCEAVIPRSPPPSLS